MRRLRDLLTFVLFFALLGVSLYAGVRAWQSGLPPLAEDRRVELRQKLAAGRVDALPREHQRQLLRQLELELREGVNWQAEISQIPLRKRELVADNIAALAALWLEEKMDAYFALPSKSEREQFVDREIQRVTLWRTTQKFRSGDIADSGGAEQALAKAVTQRLMSGALLSRPDQKLRLVIFMHDVQARWREHGIGDLMTSGP